MFTDIFIEHPSIVTIVSHMAIIATIIIGLITTIMGVIMVAQGWDFITRSEAERDFDDRDETFGKEEHRLSSPDIIQLETS